MKPPKTHKSNTLLPNNTIHENRSFAQSVLKKIKKFINHIFADKESLTILNKTHVIDKLLRNYRMMCDFETELSKKAEILSLDTENNIDAPKDTFNALMDLISTHKTRKI